MFFVSMMRAEVKDLKATKKCLLLRNRTLWQKLALRGITQVFLKEGRRVEQGDFKESINK